MNAAEKMEGCKYSYVCEHIKSKPTINGRPYESIPPSPIYCCKKKDIKFDTSQKIGQSCGDCADWEIK